MSTESNDMNPIITRANYEEYFLMYVDNELTEQERAMVDAFLQFNPELGSELALLMGAKLEPESLPFGFKENLLAENIREHHIDEALLLHVDNELDATAQKAVEQRLAQDEAYRRQHQWLLRTKSDPAEVVPHPNKKELYRHEVYRMRFGAALRVAAAVLVIASAGILLLQQNRPAGTDATVAVVKPVQTGPARSGNTGTKDTNLATKERDQPVARQVPTVAIEEQPDVPQLAANHKPHKQPAISESVNASLPVEKTATTVEEKYLATISEHRIKEQLVPRIVTPENSLPQDVTPKAPDSYNVVEPAPEPVFAAAREEGGRSNIKSLLRRATRLVERRTGINTTNEDDELLIGVVAVKLK